jgi:hypothetical protein
MKTRQELSNLFHLKAGSGKFWNIWRTDWELPGKFFVYCYRYAQFLLGVLFDDHDYDTLYSVMKKLRKSHSEVSSHELLAEEAYSACLRLCELELPCLQIDSSLQQFSLSHIDELPTKLSQAIAHYQAGYGNYDGEDVHEKSDSFVHLGRNNNTGSISELSALRWLRHIQDLQKERDFARPHLDKLREWNMKWLYELACFLGLIKTISSEDLATSSSPSRSIIDLSQETSRLLQLLDLQKRPSKANQFPISQSQPLSQPSSQNVYHFHSQESNGEDSIDTIANP